jgi:LysR family cys regulon transcriptional activator
MTLQQLRYLRAIVAERFSLSRAAIMLNTSQPAISRQIRVLEEELGTDLLIRRTNRVIGLTAAGEAIIHAARRTLWEAENLERITDTFSKKGSGKLVLATTHMYARYVLRAVIIDFMKTHPAVQVVIRQGVASMIAEWVAAGEADLGLSGKSIHSPEDITFLPLGSLDRSVIVPNKHPLLKEKKLTLEALTRFPIITLDVGTEGEQKVTKAFENAGLSPNIVMSAIDADVVKAYVESGLGIAILLSPAYEPERDRNLRSLNASHLFEETSPQIFLRNGKFLPSYMYDFIHRLSPTLDRKAVDAVLG